MGASATMQEAAKQETSLRKKGLADEAHAREKSKPLLAEYDRKMNRDDTDRIAGATNADIMQSADATPTGQLLAAGQGQQQRETGLGQGLVDGGLNAAVASKARQDGMKSGYNTLGNKKNLGTTMGMGTAASAASTVARADADAKTKENNAWMDAMVEIGASYGIKKYDDYTTANDAYKEQKSKKHPWAERRGDTKLGELRKAREESDLFGLFSRFGGK